MRLRSGVYPLVYAGALRHAGQLEDSAEQQPGKRASRRCIYSQCNALIRQIHTHVKHVIDPNPMQCRITKYRFVYKGA